MHLLAPDDDLVQVLFCRKLPSLDQIFAPESPDVPELHQGRKRSIPHRRGQWAAHIYIELEPTPQLRRLLTRAIRTSAARTKATVFPFDYEEDGSPANLHVSLSRPLILETNQREQVRSAVQSVASRHSAFSAHYANFSWLENDDRSRRFLAVEIGGGYDAMKRLTSALDAELVRMRLPAYYDAPRFHTSIAWSSATSLTADTDTSSNLAFDEATLVALEELGDKLRQDALWVNSLCLKIGKQVTRYAFTTSKTTPAI